MSVCLWDVLWVRNFQIVTHLYRWFLYRFPFSEWIIDRTHVIIRRRINISSVSSDFLLVSCATLSISFTYDDWSVYCIVQINCITFETVEINAAYGLEHFLTRSHQHLKKTRNHVKCVYLLCFARPMFLFYPVYLVHLYFLEWKKSLILYFIIEQYKLYPSFNCF